MRRAMLLVVTLSVVCLAISVQMPSVVEAQQNIKPVKIKVKCPKNVDKPNQGKFSIDIDQLVLEVEPGDGVEWELDIDNHGNDWVEVSAKDSTKWLYEKTTVKGQKKVSMTTMTKTTKGKEYDYKITVFCDNDEAVVLDPRIRVKG